MGKDALLINLIKVKKMTKYFVDKGFCFSKELGTKCKGKTLELEGEELKFALENKCVTKVKPVTTKK